MGSLLRTLLSPIATVLRALLTPAVLMVLALLTLALLVWWIGPVVRVGDAPLAGVGVRAALIGVLALLVLGPYVWRRVRARRASRILTEQLTREAPGKPARPAAPGESQVLGERRRGHADPAADAPASRGRQAWLARLAVGVGWQLPV
jgi:type VI protein secretion system component VasK